jgi:hypothetical protein
MSRALTKLQAEALTRVCRTNGGGVAVRVRLRNGHAVPTDRVLCALFDKGLTQGKAGAYETVVHTREGLELYRAMPVSTDQ